MRGHGRDNGHGEVRPDDACENINFLRLNHFVGELDGDVRLALVVLDDDFKIRIAGLFHGQKETVADVNAETGAASGQGRDHADLNRLCLSPRDADG